jgi:hypothetical protein
MIKKSFAITIILLLIITSSILVLAQTNGIQERYNTYVGERGIETSQEFKGSLTDLLDISGSSFASWIKAWEKGSDLSSIVIKYIFLILLVLLIYSALSSADFPEGKMLQLAISIIVGIIATFSINPGELVGIMRSYTALGITLSLFFPLIVLALFTYATASRLQPGGIVLQKVMWIIYAGYLILSNGTSLLISTKLSNESVFYAIAVFLGAQPIVNQDTRLISIVLLIIGIFLLWFATQANSRIVEWVARERRDADLQRYQDQEERAQAATETRAESTR